MSKAGAQVFATDVNAKALESLRRTCPLTLKPLFLMSAIRDVTSGVARVAPDILFNCAGFVHSGTILQASDDDWDFAFI